MPFKTRFRNANRNDGGKAFAEVFAGRRLIFEEVFVFAVGIQRPSQRGAEAAEVRPAFDRVNVVDVRADVFGVFDRVLERDFDLNAVGRVGDVNDFRVRRFGRAVQVANEVDEAVFVFERFGATVASVGERDLDAAVQER